MTPLALVPRSDEKLAPLERLEALCDPDSLQLVRSAVVSRRMGEKTRDGDGVAGAMGRVDGRSVACFVQDPSYLGGSVGEAQADTICRVLEQAGRARVPVVPDEQRKVYDVRDVLRTLVDGGRVLELNARWARNVVTAYARIDGRSVGVVANQPRFLGGALNSEAASKAARFGNSCDAFGLPLVVLVDTPGFLPGRAQDAGGIIRHGSKLVHAFAAASVPRVTVVLRKAFGGAFIAMSSRELGADLVLAWPRARLGIMGPKQAVDLVHRREIAAADDPTRARDRFADRYTAEHLTASSAAAEGVIDEIVAPSATRARLMAALRTLSTPERPVRPARNIQL